MAILLGHEIKQLANSAVVDAFSQTAQAVYTAPATKQVVITGLTLRCSAANSVGTPASVKVEINPAAGEIFTVESLVDVLVVDVLVEVVVVVLLEVEVVEVLLLVLVDVDVEVVVTAQLLIHQAGVRPVIHVSKSPVVPLIG